MLVRRVLAALLLCAIAPVLHAADAPATAPADAAPVMLRRPFKPGEMYDIHYIYEDKSIITPGQGASSKEIKEDSEQIDLTGRISNAVVDKAGNCQKFTLTISHLLRKGRDSIRPGSTVIITYNYGDTYSDNKVSVSVPPKSPPMPDNAKPLLERVFHGYHANGTMLDKAVGSTRPQTPGVEWTLDPLAVASLLINEEYGQLAPFNVKGTAKVIKADSPANPGARRITAEMEYRDFSPASAGKRIVISRSKATIAVNALIPADSSTPLIDEAMIVDMDIDYTTPMARAKVNQTTHLATKNTITLVTPAAGTAAAAPAGKP